MRKILVCASLLLLSACGGWEQEPPAICDVYARHETEFDDLGECSVLECQNGDQWINCNGVLIGMVK